MASGLRNYALVTAAYWAFTLTDGALRMLVLLHFHHLGYSPVELAFLFLFYELFGVVTNLVLKDHWGRARPKHVVEFGGAKTFTPPLIPTDQCPNNCAFVSGEAASIFMPFYALGLVMPQWSAVLLVVGTLGGLAAGLVRISQGAHFLSDVVFAGVFMALTALVLHRAVFGRAPLEEPDPGALAKTT